MALAGVLIFVARPLSVFATPWFSSLSKTEIALVSWVGLRGAVPIVLATYPLVVNVPNAGLLFNVVFFIFVLSVLLQGPTIPMVALISREGQFLVPRGATTVHEGDRLLLLTDEAGLVEVKRLIRGS